MRNRHVKLAVLCLYNCLWNDLHLCRQPQSLSSTTCTCTRVCVSSSMGGECERRATVLVLIVQSSCAHVTVLACELARFAKQALMSCNFGPGQAGPSSAGANPGTPPLALAFASPCCLCPHPPPPLVGNLTDVQVHSGLLFEQATNMLALVLATWQIITSCRDLVRVSPILPPSSAVLPLLPPSTPQV